MKSNVLVLGYGEMGHALEYLLKSRHDLDVWDPYYTGTLREVNLDESVSKADCIVFCTPTEPIFHLAQRIVPRLQKRCVCLTVAKALDSHGRTAPDALEQGLAGHARFGGLYGPMISEEIQAGRGAFATLASSDESTLTLVKALFEKTGLKLKPDRDIKGTAWCAVLKNVYAILFGIADELALGENMRGFLAVSTLEEMAAIVKAMGGSPDTPYSLAGLGDLITTATSENSHHHELGRLVARDERGNLTGEGINTLDVLAEKKLIDMKRFPLLFSVWKIMRDVGDAERVVRQFIDRYQ